MPRDGAVTLSDLQARGLDRLRVSCRICPRAGSYGVAKAIQERGDAKLTDLLADLRADCPRGKGPNVMDRCGAFYPDLTT